MPSSTRTPSILGWVATDFAVLCLAFVGALALTSKLLPWSDAVGEYGPAFLITGATYLATLIAGGFYRIPTRDLHLAGFIRGAAVLTLAWGGAVLLQHLLVPSHMAPRAVTAVHWMQSLIGILGLRLGVRLVRERWLDATGTPPAPLPTFTLSDALPTPPQRTPIDRTSLRSYLAGRTVLITGAGGSIGSTLARRLLDLTPFRIVLVDVSEYNLFRIENALRAEAFTGELAYRLADVRDEEAMRAVFDEFQPDLVLHAAAYKHVPLLERHPVEAFHNNTLATVGLLRLCEEFTVEQFVFISTDKAVAPTSVLGATKRLAEWYVKAAHTPPNRKIVRFGNVFGSQGSVAPLFKEQIREGGPVTVTHPDMMRFFITAEEASNLVFQTLVQTEAPVFILRMTPLRIQDLAEAMITRLRPHAAIRIRHTGLRPGEKLTEQLWDAEETPLQTAHPDILGLQSPTPYSRAELDSYLAHLGVLCRNNRTAELRKLLLHPPLAPADLPESS